MREVDQKGYSRLDIARINHAASSAPAGLIREAEEQCNAQLEHAARMIAQGADRYQVVMLCGPSASGKTTTANRLSRLLRGRGVEAQVVSMDDFFINFKDYPKLPNGEPDMEAVGTMDLQTMNRMFAELLRERRSDFPIYDFVAGRRSDRTQEIVLKDGGLLITEGIHALNPKVLENIPRDKIFRIYVSVRSRFFRGEELVFDSKDVRLLRRIARDVKSRNLTPGQTMSYWVHVLDGEKINIEPYRDDVDLNIDNTLDYEVCVWKQLLSSAVESVPPSELQQRVSEGLKCFSPIDLSLIPEGSPLWRLVRQHILNE